MAGFVYAGMREQFPYCCGVEDFVAAPFSLIENGHECSDSPVHPQEIALAATGAGRPRLGGRFTGAGGVAGRWTAALHLLSGLLVAAALPGLSALARRIAGGLILFIHDASPLYRPTLFLRVRDADMERLDWLDATGVAPAVIGDRSYTLALRDFKGCIDAQMGDVGELLR